MTAAQLALVAVAAVAILTAVGAFVIAYRRSAEEAATVALDAETLAADRSEPAFAVVGATEVAEATAAVTEEAEERAAVAAEAGAEGAEGLVPPPVVPVEVRTVVEVPPEEAGITRRQFFNRAIVGGFAAYSGGLLLSILAFMWPRLRGGFGAPVDAGAIADIKAQVVNPDGTVTPLFVPEGRAYIVPIDESELARSQFAEFPVTVDGLQALFQRCVHLGCRVPWCQPSQGFECPCHGSKYNRIGEYEAGPAPRNLDRFVVEDAGGRLIIQTARIIQTPRAQIKTVPYPQGPSCIAL